MTKKLDRIYVRPHVKRKIKSAAALEGLDMSEYVERKIDLPDIMQPGKKKKKRDPFDFKI